MAEADTDKDDEISLVDLIAVLIRHRRVVLVMTLGAAALAALAALVLPSLSLESKIARAGHEAVLSLAPGAEAAALVKPETLLAYAKDLVNDPSLVLEALVAAGYERLGERGLDAADGGRSVALVKTRLLDDAKSPYTRRFSPSGLSLSYKDRDGQRALAFMGELTKRVNARLAATLLPAAAAERQAYESLLSVGGAKEGLGAGYARYAAALRFIESRPEALSAVQAPYLLSPVIDLASLRAELIKKGVLATVAAAFLSLLMAFVLEYLRRLRQDPEAMRKLRDALARR